MDPLRGQQLYAPEPDGEKVIGRGKPALHRGERFASRLDFCWFSGRVEELIQLLHLDPCDVTAREDGGRAEERIEIGIDADLDRKSTRLNSSHT